MKEYVWQILVALSQLFNTILGGYADESVSARSWRHSRKGNKVGIVCRHLIDAFFYVITLGKDKNHCFNAYESERLRTQFPEHYRD